MSAAKKCGPKGCAVPRRVPDGAKQPGWPCHLCPEVFNSLRELNDHNRDRKTLEPKRCANPTPAAPWYTERFEKLMAEIADLKARMIRAKKLIRGAQLMSGDYDGGVDRAVDVMNLRKKAWRKA